MDRSKIDYPLRELVSEQYKTVTTFAESWLETGYRAFGTWGSEGDLIACWPSSAWDELSQLTDADLALSAPIKVEHTTVGRIGVVGDSTALKERFRAEARLVSSLITMRTRFEQAAQELVAQARLKTEIEMAAKIQIHLLPRKFPVVEGLDFYAYSNPTEQVGGDFYDFSAYPGRPFVFSIGDVSGHGLPAALLMAMTRTVLRTTAHSIPIVDPQAILRQVNEDLYDDFTEVGMFATVFVGSYDINSEQLTYSNAGHSPTIYRPVDGPTLLLKADSPMLGVLPVHTSMNYTLSFHPGDVLLVGTDGLNESFNPEGEMFGYERLLQSVEALAHLPTRELGTELLNTINQFCRGEKPSDDQTLVIIKGVKK